jgi:TonB family protein
MNRRTFATCLALSIGAVQLGVRPAIAQQAAQESGVGPAQSARRYTVKDEEFSVILPGVPTLVTTTVRRKSDGKRQLVRHVKSATANMIYSINSVENPEPKQSLEEFIEEHGAGAPFDPATKRILTVDGFAGIEYSSNKIAVVQFLATEKHLYRFIAVASDTTRPAVQEFFSSIKLGSSPEGTEISEKSDPIDDDIGEIYTGKEVDVKARILAKPEARYTDEARHNQTSGTVVLRVLFARNGTVVRISVVSGLPYGLTEQAIAAAKKIKFTPAMKEGKPVSMWMQLLYEFSL